MAVVPTITVGPMGVPPAIPLVPMVANSLRKCVVDTHAHLPDMFELWFQDEGGILANNMIDIGTSVQIKGGADNSSDAVTLITGEVTAIEAEVRGAEQFVIVRGYDRSHRMQRVTRTYVYRNMKDSDIAQLMMTKYALLPTMGPPQIDTTSGVHEAVTQFNQTDWDFLAQRAAENGYDFGVQNGALYFRKPPEAGSGKLFGFIDLPGGPPTLRGGENLLTFRPRISAFGMVPEVMVRAWDPAQKKSIVAKAKTDTVQADLDYDGSPDGMFNKFLIPPRIPDIPIPVLIPGTGASIDWTTKEVAPTSVNGDVYAVVNRAVSNSNAASGLAKSLAEHIASGWASAEGTCVGNPMVQAGASVNIENVPGYFVGSWVVTNARHVFDQEDPHDSYVTHFTVSGRRDYSMLGLTNGALPPKEPPRIDGVVPAIVVDNNDPKKEGRVRIALPWLADNYVSDWCRCLQVGMGQHGGWMLLPEPDDEVLVAFEFGDIRRPYVIGGLSNPKDSKKYPIPKIQMGKVAERGFMSRDGHKLIFKEDYTDPSPVRGSSPSTFGETGMLIEDAEGKLRVNLDMKKPMGKKVEIVVEGMQGKVSFLMADDGNITLETTAPSGALTIKSAGDMTLEATRNLNLKGTAGVKIEGAMINVEATGATAVKGNPIQLN